MVVASAIASIHTRHLHVILLLVVRLPSMTAVSGVAVVADGEHPSTTAITRVEVIIAGTIVDATWMQSPSRTHAVAVE